MADNAEKDKKDNSFMMKLATLIVDKRKGFYLIFIVLCIFCVLSMNRVKVPEYVKLRIVAVIRIVIRGSVAPIEARSLKTVLKSVRHFS